MEGDDQTGILEARLAEVDLLRRRVLNVIPHALRTPITTFRGLAQALEFASDDEIRTQITPALQRLAAQAEHLLDDMLIAAGISTALPTGQAVPTAVAATVRNVWSSVGGSDTDLQVRGDAQVSAIDGVLSKILVHVLDNARKYGQPPVEVEVEVDAATATVHLEIADHGEARPDDIAAAFEAFFRGEGAVVACSGLGVGLSVARMLAEQAGGSLALALRDGRTVAELELPAA